MSIDDLAELQLATAPAERVSSGDQLKKNRIKRRAKSGRNWCALISFVCIGLMYVWVFPMAYFYETTGLSPLTLQFAYLLGNTVLVGFVTALFGHKSPADKGRWMTYIGLLIHGFMVVLGIPAVIMEVIDFLALLQASI